jgi:hypothetical protein
LGVAVMDEDETPTLVDKVAQALAITIAERHGDIRFGGWLNEARRDEAKAAIKAVQEHIFGDLT